MTNHSPCKILFDDAGAEETLHAEHVGVDRYRLQNIPFFAPGVSLHDVVVAREDTEGLPTFVRVVEKGGHRTIRCVIDASPPDVPRQELLHGLAARGLRCEAILDTYFTIDIPPSVGLDAVVEFLITRGWRWEHADPAPPP